MMVSQPGQEPIPPGYGG